MNSWEARLSKAAAWSCIVYIVVFGFGWGVLAHNIPPYPASLGAEQIARIFRDNTVSLRIGYTLGAVSCVLYATWAIGLFRVLVSMDPEHPSGAYGQLVGGILTAPAPFFANIIWVTATFRPETDPNITRALVDLGWMFMDLTFALTVLQYVGFALVVLRDRRVAPLYPRWVAWLGLFIGLEFFLEMIMPFFRSGPFGWTGVFNYWIAFGAPFAWMIIVVVYTLRATDRLAGEFAAADRTSPERAVTSP